MEGLTLQVEGPITGRDYNWRGLKQEYIFRLQGDGLITRRAYNWGTYNRDFTVAHGIKMESNESYKTAPSCFQCFEKEELS